MPHQSVKFITLLDKCKCDMCQKEKNKKEKVFFKYIKIRDISIKLLNKTIQK